MNSQRPQLRRVLERLIDTVEDLSDNDFAKITDESFNIEIHFKRKRTSENLIEIVQDADLVNIVESLVTFPNREAARQFLDTHFSSRKALEPIARKLDIPISKQDKIEALMGKIIETTVGARVRSQAIQGGST